MAGAAGDGGVAAASPKASAFTHRPRDKATPRAAILAESLALMIVRIPSMNFRTDEARMKVA